MKHTIELDETLLTLMIDSTIKRLQSDIKNDTGKNKNHSDNLKKRYSEMLDLLKSINP